MNNLGKLAKQQKNRAIGLLKKLEQAHDKKLAESFTPITNNLEEVDKSTKNLGKVIDKKSLIDTKNLKPNLQRSQI